jgi:hypothetical protein
VVPSATTPALARQRYHQSCSAWLLIWVSGTRRVPWRLPRDRASRNGTARRPCRGSAAQGRSRTRGRAAEERGPCRPWRTR